MKLTKVLIFRATAKLGVAFIIAIIAWSMGHAQDVRTNYVPGTDFSKYHTYAWVDEVQGVPAVGVQPDQILDGQVKQAIDSQMAAKGFTKVANGSKPDLLIGFQLMIDREKQINGFGDHGDRVRGDTGGWGGAGGGGGLGGGGGFGSFSADTSTINIGTFVVGMYDPAAKKLIWIGAAQHAIDPS